MSEDADLWSGRRVAEVSRLERTVLLGLIGAGFLATLRFADWWFRAEHVESPLLFALLSLALWYGVGRVLLGWINLLKLRVVPDRTSPPGLSVAIFTTSSPGEPLEMFEHTLAACARVRYPHRTYLLDDTEDSRFQDVAERHGAVWMPLVGLPGAKAGKITRALELTDEDIVLVLDPDHVPFPEFLDAVLGHFDDPAVGYVQVAQAYYNGRRTLTARGAAEQTYTFYGPTMVGLQGHGSVVAIGANCTFRRSALESIGGHGVGLAEDLVTAIRLHAAGWRSVYVPRIVSRGLVPEDLGSFYRQQLKWSRGVFEMLFAELPRALGSLTGWQRLTYAAIGTYYLFGATTLVYLVIPYLYLWLGIQPASVQFAEFVTFGGPVAIIGVAVYLLSQRWLCHPAVERGLHLRGLVLKVACWPVFLAGMVLALARADVPYVPTAKLGVRGTFLRLAWPHLLNLAAFAITLVAVLERRLFETSEGALMLTAEAVWAMVGFAAVSALMVAGGVVAAWQSRRPPEAGAWSEIPSLPARDPT